jgi:hypothetical protein
MIGAAATEKMTEMTTEEIEETKHEPTEQEKK